jgi:pilus assembly protein CpaB
MNMRSVIIGIGALFIAVIAAVVARNIFATNAVQQVQAVQPAKEEPKKKVFVAVKALPMGTILKPEDLKSIPWPENALDPTFIQDGATSAANMAGKVVKVAVLANQPITNTSIVGPGERGFLAAVLKPGMRAVSVQVNPTTGVAGFIFPGDRVDMLLSHEVTGANGTLLRGSETVLENIRVIAVDQITNDTDKIAGIRSTVTIEVQPKFVELINVSKKLGEISLSLRPLAQTDSEKADLASKIDPATGKPVAAADMKSSDEQEPKMPPLAERSLTVDREFSKLVTLARPQNQQGPGGGGVAAASAGDGSVRPDLTISRGDIQVPVSFKTRVSTGAQPAAAQQPTQPAAAPVAQLAPQQ